MELKNKIEYVVLVGFYGTVESNVLFSLLSKKMLLFIVHCQETTSLEVVISSVLWQDRLY